MSAISRILWAMDQGQPQAAQQLLPLVYDELRELAAQKLRLEKPGQTLDGTALVHEAYLRLVQSDPPKKYNDAKHFFAAAATAMRRILIDNARRKLSEKHGGGLNRQPLDSIASPQPDEELLAVDEALRKFAQHEPQKAQLVELRYFAGLGADEAAAVLGISPSTADRHWSYARAWLQREIGKP